MQCEKVAWSALEDQGTLLIPRQAHKPWVRGGPPPQPEYIIIEYSLSYVKIVEVGPVAWDKA